MIIEQEKPFKGKQQWDLVDMNIVVSLETHRVGFLHFPRLL
jgi:hypothetical protein